MFEFIFTLKVLYQDAEVSNILIHIVRYTLLGFPRYWGA